MDQEVKENEEQKVETENTSVEVNSESKAPNKKHNFIWIILAVLAVAAIIVTVFASTVSGKVSATKVFNISKQNAVSKFYGTMLKDIESSKEENATLNIDTEGLSTLFGDSINLGSISLKNDNVKEGEDASGKLYLLVDNKEIIGLDYAKTGDVLGIAIEGLFKNYVAVENNNLKALYQKVNPDATDEDLAEVPDKIETTYFKDSSKDELIKIGKKYASTFSKFYEKNAKVEKNVSIEVYNENINTTKYNLDIDNKNCYKLLDDILKIAENDEDLYNFIEKYDTKGTLECDTFEDWQKIVRDSREEIEEDISAENYDAGMISLNIYEKNGVAVRYEIVLSEFDESAECAIMLDAIENNGNVCGMISYAIDGDYKTKYSLGINMNKSGKTYDGKCMLNISVSDYASSDIKFASFEIDLQDNAKTEIVKLTDENTLILNDATDEQIEALSGEIKENIITLAANAIKNLPENIKSKLLQSGFGE